MNKHLLIVLTTLVFLLGCTKKIDFQKVYVGFNEPEFKGLVDVIKEADRPINIVFIPGMGGYSKVNNVFNPCEIYEALKHALPFTIHSETLNSPADCLADLSYNGNAVKIVANEWNAITRQEKNHLFWAAEDFQTFGQQTYLTEQIKDFINENLSDVIMYMGVYRDPIQQQIIGTLQSLEQANPNSDYVFVTFSLGSKIMLDVVEELENQKNNFLFSNVPMVYMMANQVPLLNTGTLPLVSTGVDKTSSDEGMSGFNKLFDAQQINARGVDPIDTKKIIAFTDPNDVLSYPLSSAVMGSLDKNYANVAISVANTIHYVPNSDVLQLVDYKRAHIGHANDKRVIQLLLNGHTVVDD